jgi:hypothetical protein
VRGTFAPFLRHAAEQAFEEGVQDAILRLPSGPGRVDRLHLVPVVERKLGRLEPLERNRPEESQPQNGEEEQGEQVADLRHALPFNARATTPAPLKIRLEDGRNNRRFNALREASAAARNLLEFASNASTFCEIPEKMHPASVGGYFQRFNGELRITRALRRGVCSPKLPSPRSVAPVNRHANRLISAY